MCHILSAQVVAIYSSVGKLFRRARSGKKEVSVCLPLARANARAYTGGLGGIAPSGVQGLRLWSGAKPP